MALRLAVGEIKEKIYVRLRKGESLVLLTCEKNELFLCEGGGTEFGSADLRRGRVVLARRGAERSLAQTRDLDGE